MLSTPLLLAASISIISVNCCSSMALQNSHLQQGFPFTGFLQLIAFANILAIVVLPLPLVP